LTASESNEFSRSRATFKGVDPGHWVDPFVLDALSAEYFQAVNRVAVFRPYARMLGLHEALALHSANLERKFSRGQSAAREPCHAAHRQRASVKISGANN
jgi:hypothetical protein